jgi:hypothetical protein
VELASCERDMCAGAVEAHLNSQVNGMKSFRQHGKLPSGPSPGLKALEGGGKEAAVTQLL